MGDGSFSLEGARTMTTPESHREPSSWSDDGALVASYTRKRREARFRARTRGITFFAIAFLLLSGLPQFASAASPSNHAL